MKEKKEEEFNESFKLHKIELGPHPILCKLNTMHREIQRPIQLHLSFRDYMQYVQGKKGNICGISVVKEKTA